jgi:MFS family permease
VSSSFRALRSRNYRLWVSGTVVSNTGTWVQRTSQDWLVLTELTKHSGFATGLTTGLQFAPLLLFSAHAGVLADRLPKRRVLMFTQSLMGLSALILGLLVVTHEVQLWHVYVCATLLGCGSALDNPARQALVAEVVPRADVTSAVSLNSASINTARLIGPGLAGLIITAWGTGPGFLINAASFAAVLIALTRMRTADMYPVSRLPRRPGQVREGIRYVRQRPDLLLVFFCTLIVNMFAFNFQITNALMASGPFHRGASEYGLLGSVQAIGCLGAAVVNARRDRPRLGLVVGASIGLGSAMLVCALMPTYLLYAIVLVPVGLAMITFNNSTNTSVQLSTPPQLRGRVLALYVVIQQGTTPIGAPVVGALGTALGARWSVLAGAFAGLLAGGIGVLVLVRRPQLRARFAHELDASAQANATAVNQTA